MGEHHSDTKYPQYTKMCSCNALQESTDNLKKTLPFEEEGP